MLCVLTDAAYPPQKLCADFKHCGISSYLDMVADQRRGLIFEAFFCYIISTLFQCRNAKLLHSNV